MRSLVVVSLLALSAVCATASLAATTRGAARSATFSLRIDGFDASRLLELRLLDD